MRKEYIVPQSEVMSFSSLLLQQLPIINHSGGGGGFNNENQVG